MTRLLAVLCLAGCRPSAPIYDGGSVSLLTVADQRRRELGFSFGFTEEPPGAEGDSTGRVQRALRNVRLDAGVGGYADRWGSLLTAETGASQLVLGWGFSKPWRLGDSVTEATEWEAVGRSGDCNDASGHPVYNGEQVLRGADGKLLLWSAVSLELLPGGITGGRLGGVPLRWARDAAGQVGLRLGTSGESTPGGSRRDVDFEGVALTLTVAEAEVSSTSCGHAVFVLSRRDVLVAR